MVPSSTSSTPRGWRHQVFITNSAGADIVYLEARHRGHAHVEDRIKQGQGHRAVATCPSATSPTTPAGSS